MITDTERAELSQLRKRARVNRAVAVRARVVLACADAPDNAAVRRLRTTKTTVAKWRHRFVDCRLAGLYDEPRVGAPRTVSDAAIEAVIVKTLETTPPGETHWSTRTMARAAGLSHSAVGRIWRTFRLQPYRAESFKLSPDLQLVAKIRDVVGLSMTPPANAVVFSVDEKSQIQALQRAQPVLPIELRQPERRTHNYVRHGTFDLFAALNVATGKSSPGADRNTARRTSSPFFVRSRPVSMPRSTSMSCSTIFPRTNRRRCSGGCCVTPASAFISRRPTPRGST